MAGQLVAVVVGIARQRLEERARSTSRCCGTLAYFNSFAWVALSSFLLRLFLLLTLASDHRMRGYYGDRYDARGNLADWDYVMNLKAAVRY